MRLKHVYGDMTVGREGHGLCFVQAYSPQTPDTLTFQGVGFDFYGDDKLRTELKMTIEGRGNPHHCRSVSDEQRRYLEPRLRTKNPNQMSVLRPPVSVSSVRCPVRSTNPHSRPAFARQFSLRAALYNLPLIHNQEQIRILE